MEPDNLEIEDRTSILTLALNSNCEMVGWHHRLDGHEFQQAPGVGDGQENLAC